MTDNVLCEICGRTVRAIGLSNHLKTKIHLDSVESGVHFKVQDPLRKEYFKGQYKKMRARRIKEHGIEWIRKEERERALQSRLRQIGMGKYEAKRALPDQDKEQG